MAMKELVRTTDPTLVALVTAVLASEDIDCFVWDVHMSILEGSVGILPRRIMVTRADHFRASAILQDFGVEPA